MRVFDQYVKLNEEDTKRFFNARAQKYAEEHPYTTTMYQDRHPELAEKRDEQEKKMILPLLALQADSRILDVACGIGRWADAITTSVKSYSGIDYSDALIEIAKKRNKRNEFQYYVGKANALTQVFGEEKCFNRMIFAGICVYLNDDEVLEMFQQAEALSEERCIIYIREPVGVAARLTLKNFYSADLEAEYSAIYRTRKEIDAAIDSAFLKKGFHIQQERFMFDSPELNNRKETAQYFWILER